MKVYCIDMSEQLEGQMTIFDFIEDVDNSIDTVENPSNLSTTEKIS